MIEYNKLIRDKIPEIIAQNGQTCTVEVMNDETYLERLDHKLNEELTEYQADKSMKELGDLLEVIYAVAAARGCSAEQLDAIREKKKEERGGFSKKLLLKSVTKNGNAEDKP